jgi:MFS family permease
MAHHAHPLSSIAAVISSHVFGMFAFSVVSGRLTDSLGRPQVIAVGAVVLAASCALAPLSPRAGPLAFALLLLGLGWNLCYVGGTTLFADRLGPLERGRAQGVNDFVLGGVSAAGSLLSGTVFAAFGYARLAVLGLAVAAGLAVVAALFSSPPRFDWVRRRG